jgi:UDP-N-acetylglucosamine 2-epimerase (non-hydrolysing)
MNNKKKKIFLVGGTRPNFVKLAPIWRELKKYKNQFETKLIHAGQHYDYEMSQIFLDQFRLPKPDYALNVGSGTHGYQTAQVLIKFEEVLLRDRPDLVIVVGDVNSTLAAALASVKLNIPIAHVEAGLRSFDMNMPEEINRILTDRISNLLFVSEPSGVLNLKNEGITKSVFFVGNVMIDSLVYNLNVINKNNTVEKLNLLGKDFGVVTLHRPSNVDSKNSLKKILTILKLAASERIIVFSIHPRTIKNIESFRLKKQFTSIKNLRITESLGYLEFMNLIVNSKLVITDSGGIQEETTWLGVPCITLRGNTERPVTVTNGTNTITGLDITLFEKALNKTQKFNNKKYKPPKLWDGKTANRIITQIKKFIS